MDLGRRPKGQTARGCPPEAGNGPKARRDGPEPACQRMGDKRGEEQRVIFHWELFIPIENMMLAIPIENKMLSIPIENKMLSKGN